MCVGECVHTQVLDRAMDALVVLADTDDQLRVCVLPPTRPPTFTLNPNPVSLNPKLKTRNPKL